MKIAVVLEWLSAPVILRSAWLISREGGLIDMGVEHGFVRKSGAWYTYESGQLGQGKENARTYLKDNPDIANEIEKKIKEKLGVGPRLDAPAEEVAAEAVPRQAAPETAAAAAPAKTPRASRAKAAAVATDAAEQ